MPNRARDLGFGGRSQRDRGRRSPAGGARDDIMMSSLPDPHECRARARALLKRAAAAEPKEKQELEAAAAEYEKLADEIERFQRDR